jgi:2-(1,2-epoxy-1,2-dihydrophenyl)acetyl-CoA isomerase
MSESERHVVVNRDEAVLTIRLSRPENRNSLTDRVREEIGQAVRWAESDRGIRAVYLTGTGSSFCAGGDLKAIEAACDPWPVHQRFRNLRHWLIPLVQLEKPVVVGLNGHAVGGGMGLALSGDVIIAAETASFMAGFFRLGAIPDAGVMYHLPRMIGIARTKNFLFTNATMTAEQAAALGIVAKVVPAEMLDEHGLRLAHSLADGPSEIVGLTKSLLMRSFETDISEMFAFEGLGQALAMSNPEFREGLAAILQRRAPDFAAAASRSNDPASPTR